jgi:2-aminoethylphosphonate-pyruvate transaminase
MKKNIILTAAPANTTDTVKLAQVVQDICPREKEFGNLLSRIQNTLLDIVQAPNERYAAILLTGSGTAAMDATINSVIGKGTLLIIENGAYGKRFAEIAASYRISHRVLQYDWGSSIQISELEEVFSAYPDIEAVATVHHETTTGILNDIKAIGTIAKKYNKTYIVDTISSFGGIPVDITETKADYLIGSANKCLQGMPGISFVIANKEHLEKVGQNCPRSYYLNLYKNYSYFCNRNQTPFTPAVQCLYALDQALTELEQEGLSNRHKRYIRLWTVLNDGMKKLGFQKLLKDEVESHLITTYLEPKNFDFEKVHDELYKRGITIYPGKLLDIPTFRVGNLGAISEADIEIFLVNLKNVMRSL